MPRKRLNDVTHGELLAREMLVDEEFAREWERQAPARLVAAKLIQYRGVHGLSQRQLADLVGVKQPQIARWEAGESLPQPENLSRLAGKLKIEFVFSYAPADREPKQITRSTRERAEAYAEGEGVVRFAATP